MENKNIITTISNIEPPKYLKGVILARLAKEQQKRQLRRKMLLISGFLVSGVGVITSLAYFGSQIMSSDFFSIASLGLTDWGTVAGHWQDFAESLLETLPVVSIIAVLAPVAAILLLIKYYANHVFNFNNTLTA